MMVNELGLEYQPRLWENKPRNSETTYTINAIPFGGFVKIQGEDGDDRVDQRSFSTKSFWRRASVILAGVIMNVILAMVLLSLVYMIGARPAVIITQIVPGSPAEVTGLKTLDEIVGFDSVEATQKYITDNRGTEIELSVLRGDEHLAVRLTPRRDPPPGQGAIGIALAQAGQAALPWHQALWHGVKDTFAGLWFIITSFAMIIKNLFAT